MALIDLWQSSRAQPEDKSVAQIIGFAGDGRLLDNSETSEARAAGEAQTPTLSPGSLEAGALVRVRGVAAALGDACHALTGAC
jgi:hypothetical protein